VMYTCEKCEAELDDDVDAVMILKRPEQDPVAYCMDNVACTEAGADAATTAVRREAIGIKPETHQKPDKEE
jgi:hypothetical protein